MSNWISAIHELHELVVETAVDLKIINCFPDRFAKRADITIRRDTRRDGTGRSHWTGGCNERRGADGRYVYPIVTATDHVRYTEKAPWLSYLSTYTFNKQVFRTASRSAKAGRWDHIEYHRIAMDPEIGSFASDDPEDHLLAAMCHEVAHCIQHWDRYWMFQNIDTLFTARQIDWKPHGEFWRETYRALRNELYNPWRTAPVACAANEETR